jgi:Cof subfamily protein (haloacid dehalogenase superfamily)
MYRLLALDLDGTLLTPDHMITPRTYIALQKAAAKGMTLVVATGQTLDVVRTVCAQLPLTAPQILYNGAIIADIHKGIRLHEQFVPPEHIMSTISLLRNLNLYCVYHTPNRVYVDQGTPNARNWYRPPVPPVIEVEDVASLYPQTCIKLVGVGNRDTLREKRAKLEESLAGLLYITQASRSLLECLHPAVSKGNALAMLCSMLNIHASEVVAIGDNHNDIGMLRFAGLGIAMGHAHEEVKTAANYITRSNSEDGVAFAIEEKVLPLL